MSWNRPRITQHQKHTLNQLERLSRAAPDGWVHDADCGGPAALGHLYRKGYVARETRYGPRGGERLFYRPLP